MCVVKNYCAFPLSIKLHLTNDKFMSSVNTWTYTNQLWYICYIFDIFLRFWFVRWILNCMNRHYIPCFITITDVNQPGILSLDWSRWFFWGGLYTWSWSNLEKSGFGFYVMKLSLKNICYGVTWVCNLDRCMRLYSVE